MERKSFMLLIMLLACIAATAQRNRFQLGIGYQKTWLLDKQASPLTYQSGQKTFTLGYENKSDKSIFNLELSGALGDFFPAGHQGRKWYHPGYNEDGSPKQDSNFLAGTFYQARFRAGYLWRLNGNTHAGGEGKSESLNYAGASISNQLFYADNIVRAGWLNATSADAVFRHISTFDGKHRLSLKITIPLFSYNTRLPYHNTVGSPNGDGEVKTIYKQGSRFTTIFDFQNLQVDAGYEYTVSKNFSIGLRYFGQWLHYDHEKPVTLYQNNISVITSFTSAK
jgi:hypothetical protein